MVTPLGWERDARNYVIFSTEDIIGEINSDDEDEYNNRDNNSDEEDY